MVPSAVDTGWTKPLQYTVAVFLVLWAVVGLVYLFLLGRNLRPYYTDSLGRTMPSGQAASMAGPLAALVAGGLIVFAVICLLMAWASTQGWGWAFWVDLVLLGLGGIGAFRDLGTLANSTAALLPGAIFGELLNVAALALFLWFLVALIKYGVWARVKVRGPRDSKRSTSGNRQ